MDYTRYTIEICREGGLCSLECPRLSIAALGKFIPGIAQCDLFKKYLGKSEDGKHPMCCKDCLNLTEDVIINMDEESENV